MKYKHYLVFSLFLVLLMYPCLLIEEIILTRFLRIPVIYGQLLIFMNLTVLMLWSVRTKKIKISNTAKINIQFLIIITLYLGIRYFATPYFINVTRVTIKNIFIGCLFVIILWGNIRHHAFIVNMYIMLGAIISLIAIAGEFGFLLGIIPGYIENIKSYGGGLQNWINISNLGYFNYGPMNISHGVLPRLQSYWTEPARFAQFLIIPFMLLLDQYNKKFKWHKASLIIMAIAFILTFSNTNIISGLFFLTLAIVVRQMNEKKIRNGSKITKHTLRTLIIVGFLSIVLYSVFQLSSRKEGSSVFSKDINQNIDNRIQGGYVNAFKYAIAYPFGNYSFFNNKLFRVQPAPVNALILGGFPLIIIIFIWLTIILRRFWHNGGKTSFYFYGLLSYIVAICWYGTFFQYQFLFNLALASILFTKRQPVIFRNKF